MKKLLIAILVATPIISTAIVNKYSIQTQTNSVCINGSCFPLNSIVLKISTDSVKCQFFTVLGYGNSYGYTPITLMDSAKHFYNNGVQLTSVSSVDSLFIAKFVK